MSRAAGAGRSRPAGFSLWWPRESFSSRLGLGQEKREGLRVLQDRLDLLGKQPHVLLTFGVGHAAVAELSDEVVHAGLVSDLGDLVETLLRRTGDVQAGEE